MSVARSPILLRFLRMGVCIGQKVPTTRENPAEAACAALETISLGVDFGKVAALTHGTTVCTNAILERRLQPAGFITTAGYPRRALDWPHEAPKLL